MENKKAGKVQIRGGNRTEQILDKLSEKSERNTKQELGESEIKYKVLLENARDIILTFDLHGKVTSTNKAITELGFRKDEIIGKNILTFVSSSYRQKILRDLTRAFRGEQVEGQVELNTPKDKKIVEYKTNPIIIGKKIIGTQAVLRDVTERESTEDKLRTSEQKYRFLFEEAMDAVFLVDAETDILIDCNHAATELVGREKSELIGKHQRILFPPHDTEEEFSRIFQHLKEKGGQIQELNILTKERKLKNVAIKANFFELEGKKIIQWVFKDVTERKKAEELLTHERELLQALMDNIFRDITEHEKIEKIMEHERDTLQTLMDNIPDTIYFKDVNSKFIRINKAQATVLGLKDPKEAEGKTDFDFVMPEQAQDAFNDEQEIFKTGKPMINKVERIRRTDGQFRWVSATKVPIIDNEGKINGIVGISRDVTEQKLLEEELRRYSEHLESLVEERTKKLQEAQRLAAIGETTAIIGHDLRNPLQAIVNVLYLIEKSLENPTPQNEEQSDTSVPNLLKVIYQQVGYMNKIVSDLQDYAKPIKPELAMTDLRELVYETLSALEVSANIKVSVKAEEHLELLIDPALIKRVFTNLILNALQAMPNGGELTIKASIKEESVSISFQDTGIGIPEENLPKLFKPLFTTKSKGQGFGLAVCKRIVEAHEGNITVCSEVGKGSTFTVNIPLKHETL